METVQKGGGGLMSAINQKVNNSKCRLFLKEAEGPDEILVRKRQHLVYC